MFVTSLDETKVMICNILLKKQINQHSNCSVELLLKEWSYESDLEKLVGEKLCIQDENTLYFCGVVTKLRFTDLNYERHVTLELHSLSLEFEKKLPRRIFQSEEKTWKEVFDYISSQSSDAMTIHTQGDEFPTSVFPDNEGEKLLVQNSQSDFQFLLDVGKELSCSLFVDDTSQSACALYLGSMISENKTVLAEEDFFSCGKERTKSWELYTIETRIYVPFGSNIEIYGFSYVIVGFNLENTEDVVVYHYDLRRSLENEEKDLLSPFQKGSCYMDLGQGKVLSKEDPKRMGRVQVKFLDWEDPFEEKAIWLPYLPNVTEGDRGVVSVPSPDEIVRVTMGNQRGFVLGCERGTAIREDLDVVAHHTMEFHQGKVQWTEENLSVSFGETTSVSYSDEKMESKGKNIHVTAEENIAQIAKLSQVQVETTLEIGAGDVKMEGEKTVTLGSADVKVTSDNLSMSGKQVSVSANQNLELAGSNLALSGSQKIDAKTSKFNIV